MKFRFIAVLLIGGGGLGSMIFEGLTNFNTTKILAGTLPVIGIALFLDFATPVWNAALPRNILKYELKNEA